MAFTQFTDDMNIIAKLSDSPNVDDGLTADQLKAKFDEAGKAIKNYINTVLLLEALERPTFAGLVRSNGRSLVEAEAGTDYQAPIAEKEITRAMLADDVTAAALGGTPASVAKTVKLPAGESWVENAQTVNVEGVTADNNIIVTPADAVSRDYWNDAGVFCTEQGEGTLTFSCTETPEGEITANVLIVG